MDLSSLKSLVANNGSSITARNLGVVALPADFNSAGIVFTGVTPGITFPVAPRIIQQPVDKSVPLNGTATFNIVAEGTPPITYRWQLEATQNSWQNIAGQTTATLTITGVHFGKEGRYRCILVNVGGLVISRGALLRVGDDPDTDSDGLPDSWEQQYLGDLTKGPNDDPDADGLINTQEYERGTNPTLADTDADGLADKWETENGLNPLVQDGGSDADNDGLSNLQEQALGTDPRKTDTDGDGLADKWESDHGLNPTRRDSGADPDNDSLTNLEEQTLGTNPTSADTDGDGFKDGTEVDSGSNPTDGQSRPAAELHILVAVELELATQSNVIYQLQSSMDLQTWTDFGQPFTGDGSIYRTFVTLRDREVQFFRLKPQ